MIAKENTEVIHHDITWRAVAISEIGYVGFILTATLE